MTTNNDLARVEALCLFPSAVDAERRYVGWFHELDSWTEYWDVYQPETKGRYYFGDGVSESGLLRRFLPRDTRPPAFVAWTQMALSTGTRTEFVEAIRVPDVASAVMEVDGLVGSLFTRYFGDAADPVVQRDYLEAVFRFAIDTLPAATERDARIPADDPRKSTAGRHRLEGDLMWFAWALQIEAAEAIGGALDQGHLRRLLQLAAVAMGCSADFTWRAHRRTRPEYAANATTVSLLRDRVTRWAADFDAAAAEVHALFRIREWGSEA